MQPGGQFDTGVDAVRKETTLKRAKPGRPGRLPPRTARSLTAVLLVAFAAILALPLQAQAQTTGICGRTAEVIDGILDEISGITDCALVTDDHLAAITGRMDMEGVTALAAGDFDGLTALEELFLGTNNLNSNSLTTLPDDVFDGLTALEKLWLNDNSLITVPADVFEDLTSLMWLSLSNNNLDTLPADVFDGLTTLTVLSLADNSLTTLPYGVLEDLTSLTWLWLQNNPGAPFVPTADALPDDGTVSPAGGTVTLDGSGSGGAWGTNVTYRWALTSPASGVTFDDATSAKPVVTIPALTVGAELTFTLTVNGRATPLTDTDTATVTVFDPNAPTAFDSSVTTNEDTAYTFAASDFNFSDPNAGDALASVTVVTLPAAGTLALDGAAVTAGQSVPAADIGKLAFTPAANANGTGYASFTFRVSDGTNESALAYTMTVNVTAMNDPATGAPTISGTAQVGETLRAATTGIADVDGLTSPTYGYQWVRVDGANETDIAGATSGAYTLVAADIGKKVRVKVSFTDDDGSDEERTSAAYPASGTVEAAPNRSPSFTSPATFSAAENQTTVGTVAASDSDSGDSVTGYTIQGGADRSKFSIVASTGVVTFASAPNFEAPADADTGNDYVVVVRAMSGAGERAKTADQTITVTVTDVDGEAPGVPVAPSVSSASLTSVTATWTAPANAGPAITDYDYRYRVTSPVGSWTEVTSTTTTALGATITGLAENTEYDVQVRATNDEGTSDWSASGSGSTDANASPSFTSPATFNAAENQTSVGTVAASDSDSGDSVTGYAIHGGADASKFFIDASTGVVTFASAPNFEAPADADTGNDYVVVVRAMSGTGARAKTADQTITVTVTDVAGEAPGVPASPSVSSASATSLTATWTAPANAGPAITDYDYRYRVTSPVGDWTEVTNTTITALGATIAALAENTEYEVQVRAANDEGTSGWSASGSGSTDANASPSFTSPATFNAAENQTSVGTAQAADSDTGDSVTGYAIHGGADRSKFLIVEASGVVTFASAPNFEAPADADTGNDYVVVVRAMSGTGARAKTAEQTITVTVTDVDGEAPGVPVAPSVSSASATSVNVSWTAPVNAGPAITDYDYRYRVMSPQGSWTEVTTTTITALGATIAGLAENTEYEVQVRAANDEGTSDWSASGSGSTDANASPSFTSPATFNAPENQTTVGTVAASDSDSGDSVTGYAIHGGADASKFSLVASTGVVTFASAPNFEAPADADTGNDYVVVVRAMSGAGSREKTADQTITVTVTDVDGEAPGVPAVPLVSSASMTSLNVSWTTPTNAGPAITDYDYRYRVMSPQGSWTEVTTTTITAFGATIVGLAENTEYEVQVRAANDEGTSGWSASGSGSTDAVGTPDRVTGVSLIEQAERLMVFWNEVVGASGYKVQWKSGGQGYNTGDRQATVPSGSTTSHTITSLTNGTEYTVRVIATRTGSADGPPSAEVTGTPMAAIAAGVTVTPTALTVPEGSSTTYEVVLATQPSDDVTITVSLASGSDADITVNTASLTFTPDDWSVAQQVTVMAAEDTDAWNGSATIEHAVSGGDYGSLTASSVTATESDNDEAGVTVTPTELTVREGASATYAMFLTSAPTEPITIDMVVSGDPDVTITPLSLAFTSDNWDTAQQVTVMAAEDTDREDDAAMLDHKASGGDYGEVTIAAVAVTVTDVIGGVDVSAWLARYSRVGADHLLSSVENRMESIDRGGSGAEASIAGQRIVFGDSPAQPGMELSGASAIWSASQSYTTSSPRGGRSVGLMKPFGMTSGLNAAARRYTNMTLRDALSRSAFRYAREMSSGNSFGVWGQGSFSRFSGSESGADMDGDVMSGTVGIDNSFSGWLHGIAVSRSESEGAYRIAGEDSLSLSASLTGLYPYMRYNVTNRLRVWGTGGYGRGSLRLQEDSLASSSSDLSMALGSIGVTGDIVSASSEGFGLSWQTDAMLVRSSLASSRSISSVEAIVHRLRLSLESSYTLRMGDRASLAPKLELGVRRDGGDAEQGMGLDVAGGLGFVNSAWGLRAQVDMHGMLVHEDSDFEQWGVSGMILFDRSPSLDIGASLRLFPSWGSASSSTGGMRALWSRETVSGLAGFRRTGGDDRSLRLAGRFDYGFAAFGKSGVTTPYASFSLSGNEAESASAGADVEIGGGLGYSNRSLGLRMRAGMRGLMSEEEVGFEQWGASGVIFFDPDPSSPLGASFNVSQSWGITPRIGFGGSQNMGTMREREPLPRSVTGMSRPNLYGQPMRIEGEMGYGFSASDGDGVATPYAGIVFSDRGRSGLLLGFNLQASKRFLLNLESSTPDNGKITLNSVPEFTVRGLMKW